MPRVLEQVVPFVVHFAGRLPKRGSFWPALALAILPGAAWAQGAGYWHTSGNHILDEDGAEVRMAGVNWYGFETTDYLAHGLWAQDYKTVLNTIKSLGYNIIRIPFSNQMVESDPIPTNFATSVNGEPSNSALVGQTALADLDTIVAYAGSIGLRVILDNHRSEAGSSNEANGLWYTSSYPQSQWLADWRTMAARYSASRFTFGGNPTVIGVDLRNEPHLLANGGYTGGCWTGDTQTNGAYNGCPASLTSQNWPVAAAAAGNAVLAINPKLLIFVEGTDCYDGTCGWQGENLIGVAANPVSLSTPNQLVYSAHDYGPALYQQPWFNGSTTPGTLNTTWNKFWGYISVDGTAPVWLGEFGTDNTSADIEGTAAGSQGQWFESMIGYLQSNPAIHWTYWALNGEDSYAVLDSNYDTTPVSSLKQSLLESVQAPLGATSTPGFNLEASAGSLALTSGSTTSDTITINAVDGFTGSVTLGVTGLPGGVTAAFATNPTTGSSVMKLTAGSTATVGTASIIVTGTSGSKKASTSLVLTISAKSTPSFTLSSSNSVSVHQGSSATDSIKVIDISGFKGSVTLAAAGLPSGVSAVIAPNPTSTSSTVTLKASSTATPGTSTITINGTSGTFKASTNVGLTITPAAASGFACHVAFTISNQWQGGFGAALTINNTGSTAISNWTLTWTFANGQTVTQLWNGTETQSGSTVTVSNLSYNGSIPAGSSYTGLGFNGSWNNTTNTVPASFAVNGTVCK